MKFRLPVYLLGTLLFCLFLIGSPASAQTLYQCSIQPDGSGCWKLVYYTDYDIECDDYYNEDICWVQCSASENGCSSTDTDGDGIPDSTDTNDDNDLLPDSTDQCDTQAEDIDNCQDFDGCPEPPSACQNPVYSYPSPPSGCTDSDGDGICDSFDQCDFIDEDIDSCQDFDGCPESPSACPIPTPVPTGGTQSPRAYFTTGPTNGNVGETLHYRAVSTGTNLTQLDILIANRLDNLDSATSWTTLGSRSCSGGFCDLDVNWVPDQFDSNEYFIIVVNAYGTGVQCSGNPARNTNIWADCDPFTYGDFVNVYINTYTQPAPSLPPAAPSPLTPPTATISGPSSGLAGNHLSFAGYAQGSDLSQIGIWIADESANLSVAASWSELGSVNCFGQHECSINTVWIPDQTDSNHNFIVVINAFSGNSTQCSGNPFRNPDIWSECSVGEADLVRVNITFAPQTPELQPSPQIPGPLCDSGNLGEEFESCQEGLAYGVNTCVSDFQGEVRIQCILQGCTNEGNPPECREPLTLNQASISGAPLQSQILSPTPTESVPETSALLKPEIGVFATFINGQIANVENPDVLEGSNIRLEVQTAAGAGSDNYYCIWNYGDGLGDISDSCTPEGGIYPPGRHAVSVYIVNSAGEQSSRETVNFRVRPFPKVTTLSSLINGQSVNLVQRNNIAPITVTFVATVPSEMGDDYACRWNFGDDQGDSAPMGCEVIKTYSAGTRSVSVFVVDSLGQQSEKSGITFTVIPAPTPTPEPLSDIRCSANYVCILDEEGKFTGDANLHWIRVEGDFTGSGRDCPRIPQWDNELRDAVKSFCPEGNKPGFLTNLSQGFIGLERVVKEGRITQQPVSPTPTATEAFNCYARLTCAKDKDGSFTGYASKTWFEEDTGSTGSCPAQERIYAPTDCPLGEFQPEGTSKFTGEKLTLEKDRELLETKLEEVIQAPQCEHREYSDQYQCSKGERCFNHHYIDPAIKCQDVVTPSCVRDDQCLSGPGQECTSDNQCKANFFCETGICKSESLRQTIPVIGGLIRLKELVIDENILGDIVEDFTSDVKHRGEAIGSFVREHSTEIAEFYNKIFQPQADIKLITYIAGTASDLWTGYFNDQARLIEESTAIANSQQCKSWYEEHQHESRYGLASGMTLKDLIRSNTFPSGSPCSRDISGDVLEEQALRTFQAGLVEVNRDLPAGPENEQSRKEALRKVLKDTLAVFGIDLDNPNSIYLSDRIKAGIAKEEIEKIGCHLEKIDECSEVQLKTYFDILSKIDLGASRRAINLILPVDSVQNYGAAENTCRGVWGAGCVISTSRPGAYEALNDEQLEKLKHIIRTNFPVSREVDFNLVVQYATSFGAQIADPIVLNDPVRKAERARLLSDYFGRPISVSELDQIHESFEAYGRAGEYIRTQTLEGRVMGTYESIANLESLITAITTIDPSWIAGGIGLGRVVLKDAAKSALIRELGYQAGRSTAELAERAMERLAQRQTIDTAMEVALREVVRVSNLEYKVVAEAVFEESEREGSKALQKVLNRLSFRDDPQAIRGVIDNAAEAAGIVNAGGPEARAEFRAIASEMSLAYNEIDASLRSYGVSETEARQILARVVSLSDNEAQELIQQTISNYNLSAQAGENLSHIRIFYEQTAVRMDDFILRVTRGEIVDRGEARTAQELVDEIRRAGAIEEPLITHVGNTEYWRGALDGSNPGASRELAEVLDKAGSVAEKLPDPDLPIPPPASVVLPGPNAEFISAQGFSPGSLILGGSGVEPQVFVREAGEVWDDFLDRVIPGRAKPAEIPAGFTTGDDVASVLDNLAARVNGEALTPVEHNANTLRNVIASGEVGENQLILGPGPEGKLYLPTDVNAPAEGLPVLVNIVKKADGTLEISEISVPLGVRGSVQRNIETAISEISPKEIPVLAREIDSIQAVIDLQNEVAIPVLVPPPEIVKQTIPGIDPKNYTVTEVAENLGLGERLGKGEFGTVYIFGENSVVKLYNPLVGPIAQLLNQNQVEVLARWTREFSDSPLFPKLRTIFYVEDETGKKILIGIEMEKIEGQTLKEFTKDGGKLPKDAIDRALAEHRRITESAGIPFGDLDNLGNIYVHPDLELEFADPSGLLYPGLFKEQRSIEAEQLNLEKILRSFQKEDVIPNAVPPPEIAEQIIKGINLRNSTTADIAQELGLGRELGRGAVGTVFETSEGTAVKVFDTSAGQQTRVLNESQVEFLRKLTEDFPDSPFFPKLKKVFYAEDQDGNRILVGYEMELVEGKTLKEFFEAGGKLDKGAIDRALAEHKRITNETGLMFGDLKGENIIIRPDGELVYIDQPGLKPPITVGNTIRTVESEQNNLEAFLRYLQKEEPVAVAPKIEPRVQTSIKFVPSVVYEGDRYNNVLLAEQFGEYVSEGRFGTTFRDPQTGALTKIFKSTSDADLRQIDFYEAFGGEAGISNIISKIRDGSGNIIGFQQEYIGDAVPFLEARLRGIKLTPEEVQAAIYNLEEIHRLTGRAHGDLKLENILVQTVIDESGNEKHVVRFIDFSNPPPNQSQIIAELEYFKRDISKLLAPCPVGVGLIPVAYAQGVPCPPQNILERARNTVTGWFDGIFGSTKSEVKEQTSLEDIVNQVDTYLTRTGSPNELECRGGACGLSAGLVNRAAENSGKITNMYQVQDLHAALGLSNLEKPNGDIVPQAFAHAITIVEQDDQKYLVDLTFTQFVDRNGVISSLGRDFFPNPAGRNLQDFPVIQQLLEQGYIPLTDDNLRQYLKATAYLSVSDDYLRSIDNVTVDRLIPGVKTIDYHRSNMDFYDERLASVGLPNPCPTGLIPVAYAAEGGLDPCSIPGVSQILNGLDTARDTVAEWFDNLFRREEQTPGLDSIENDLQNKKITPELVEFWSGIVRDTDGRLDKYRDINSDEFNPMIAYSNRLDLNNEYLISYLNHSLNARREFLRGVEEGRYEGNIDDFKSWLSSLHTEQTYTGRGDEIRTLEGSAFSMGTVVNSDLKGLAEKYNDPLFGFVTNPQQHELAYINLPGISQEGRPVNQIDSTGVVTHNYPDPKYFNEYLVQAQNRLIRLESLGRNATDEELELIAEFYQYLINSRMFGQGNNSLFMNMANGLLEQRGLKPMEHGVLDFAAFSLQPETFSRHFVDEVKEAQAKVLTFDRTTGRVITNPCPVGFNIIPIAHAATDPCPSPGFFENIRNTVSDWFTNWFNSLFGGGRKTSLIYPYPPVFNIQKPVYADRVYKLNSDSNNIFFMKQVWLNEELTENLQV